MEALARGRGPNSAALRAVYKGELDAPPPVKQIACYLQAENSTWLGQSLAGIAGRLLPNGLQGHIRVRLLGLRGIK